MDFYFIIQENTILTLSPIMFLLPSKQIYACFIDSFLDLFSVFKAKNVNMNKVTYLLTCRKLKTVPQLTQHKEIFLFYGIVLIGYFPL